ncbi:ATP-binding protein [Acidaminobacter sp. JC074]|uniref:ATP-binding protein n=1 Tax=Acidaminobacter sp. JC074 TaxID=2530199 RepID=UPI001F114EDA|nr:ATP-binding protein [Acidaminobacter sp. JC074]
MKRRLTADLLKWKQESARKPLMVIGARQVGKTYSINEFCTEQYQEYIYLNLDKDKDIVQIFEESIDPDEIIRNLGLYRGKAIDASNTIIFIDEVQVSERAITSLKYFAEHKLDYKIIVAGSLLGVALNRFKSSYPVGKVERLYMYPMDFEEFLWAIDEKMLSDEIKKHFTLDQKIFNVIHEKLLKLYKDFLYVGGMPESVLSYKEAKGDLNHYNSKIKKTIIEDYIADMSKYTTNAESIKVNQVYQSIPIQLGSDNHRFNYKLVSDKGKKAYFGTAIEWLIQSKLVHKVTLIETPKIPLKAYHKENMFKVYMNDVGLLMELADMTPLDINASGSKLYSGMITENYVAQMLAKNFSLYYWRSGNTAEIDFLINVGGHIIPVEVKASTNTKSKALKVYIEKYNPNYAIKISAKNFGFSNGIKSVPLYAVHLLGHLKKH